MSKAAATNPPIEHSRGKLRVILGDITGGHPPVIKGAIPSGDGPPWYQLVGGVMAHQGYDAYRACERGPAHWD